MVARWIVPCRHAIKINLTGHPPNRCRRGCSGSWPGGYTSVWTRLNQISAGKMGTTGYLVPAVRKKQTLPWIAFAAVCFFWGTTAPAIRVAVRYFPPLLLSAVRFALSGALLLSVLVAMRKGPKNWLTAIRRSVPGGLSLAVANALTCVGLATVQSGQGALLLATTALWMTIIDGLWPSSGRRTSPLAWLGLIFGLGGVGLLLDSPTSLLGLSTGTVVLLVSALGWALGSVWQSRHPSHLPPLQEAALQMLVSAVVLIPAAYVLGERWNPAIPALGWRAFIFLVLTGISDWFRLIRVHIEESAAQGRGTLHVRQPAGSHLGRLVVAG